MKKSSACSVASCFVPAALVLAGCGQVGTATEADVEGFRGGVPVQGSYAQTWAGQTACLQLVETQMPQQQQQGDKGKQITWSVCQARVQVKCVGAKTDAATERTLWTPKQCVATLQGTLLSSQMAQEPQAFQWSQSYDVSADARPLQVSIGEGTYFIAGSLRTPSQWDVAPQLQLGLSKQGNLAPVQSSSVALTLQSR